MAITSIIKKVEIIEAKALSIMESASNMKKSLSPLTPMEIYFLEKETKVLNKLNKLILKNQTRQQVT